MPYILVMLAFLFTDIWNRSHSSFDLSLLSLVSSCGREYILRYTYVYLNLFITYCGTGNHKDSGCQRWKRWSSKGKVEACYTFWSFSSLSKSVILRTRR